MRAVLFCVVLLSLVGLIVWMVAGNWDELTKPSQFPVHSRDCACYRRGYADGMRDALSSTPAESRPEREGR